MVKSRWHIYLGIFLIVLSGVFYYVHYLIFRDAHHIFIFLLGDIAFVFIEVLLVSMILHELLNEREKQERIEKLYMVVGAFFSEVGIRLLNYFATFDPLVKQIEEKLIVSKEWTDKDFVKIRKEVKNINFHFNVSPQNLKYLHGLFIGNKGFLLRILENPTLHEHETFTQLLWAVSHLIEELDARDNFDDLPDTDINHLMGDGIRAYSLLTLEWLDYMKHLMNNYPFLFSFAMRTNPFNKNASVVVSD